VNGAGAGIVAAAAWAASEPALGRVLGTSFSDVRLLGRLATRRRAWPVVGLALHLANGAAFGAAFERLGLRGAGRGLLVAQAENVALWPAMLVVDRIHPDRRDGRWPPLFANPRVAAYEVATHALFGAVLGGLLAQRAATSPVRRRRLRERVCTCWSP
jgi:hypothetical protein